MNTVLWGFFSNDVHSVNGLRATRVRGSQSKRHCSLIYAGKITTEPKLTSQWKAKGIMVVR